MISRIRSIDIENTGNSPADGGIIEIGFADVVAMGVDFAGEPRDWIVKPGFGILSNPGVPISAESSAVHHLTDDDVRWEPPFEDVVNKVLATPSEDGTGEAIDAYAAFGADTEKEWLGPFLGEKPIIDVYKCALRLWPDAPRFKQQVLRYWRRPSGMDRSLASPAHRAAPDAYVNAHLLRDMLNDGARLEGLMEWSAEPALLVKCYKGIYRNGGQGTPWEDVDSSFLYWMLERDFSNDELFTARYHLKKREEEHAALNANPSEYDDVI